MMRKAVILKSLYEIQYNLWLNDRQIFKKLFEEGLQIQKQRLRDLRNYAKEKRSEEKRQHQNELDSMENYYKDQVGRLAAAAPPVSAWLSSLLANMQISTEWHSTEQARLTVSKANLRQYVKQYAVCVALFKMEYWE